MNDSLGFGEHEHFAGASMQCPGWSISGVLDEIGNGKHGFVLQLPERECRAEAKNEALAGVEAEHLVGGEIDDA